MRRVLVSGLLYLGTVLPLHAIVLPVELVARGHHTASALDGISEWAVFIAPSLMLLGATAVPVSILAYRAVKRRVPAAHRAWWLAGLMPLLLALNVVILGLVISISGGSPWSLTPLVIMSPIAFVLSAAAYGWVLGRRNWPPGHAAHEVWKWGSVYVVPAMLILVYAHVMPLLAPTVSYRISGTGVRMKLEERVLSEVRPGTPVAQLNELLPGFVAQDVLEGKFQKRMTVYGSGFSYSIVFDSSRVKAIEVERSR